MDDIVPGALQRLREADIVGLAGLSGASLGQEYARSGCVSVAKRQETHLSGVITIPDTSPELKMRVHLEQPKNTDEHSSASSTSTQRFEVDAEVLSQSLCQAVCTCGNQATMICVHAAALLYQWIYHSSAFLSLPPAAKADVVTASPGDLTVVSSNHMRPSAETPAYLPASLSSSGSASLPVRNLPVNTISETLAQFGLGELRAIAREYGIVVANLGKQQLVETMVETLSQPEVIRRIVGTLAKAQRQLLAAFALAGGSMSDEELRGLFERFALDNAGLLQDMLVALQARLLLVRTSFNHSLQQRTNLHISPLDISWYIPQEVREALHIALPVTPFDVTVPYGKNGNNTLPSLRLAEPSKLLADLLMVARSLDGAADEPADRRSQRGSAAFSTSRLPVDGSLALPPPEDQPSPSMIEALLAVVRRSPSFLRFAVRLLRLENILYKNKDDSWLGSLRLVPDAAQLLLSATRLETLRRLFTRWVSQASYAELFELTEMGVHVRCRATPLNQPALRRGELELENSEARQELLSLLAQVPVGEWINFSAFARFIYRLHPTFLQRRQRLFPSPHWWIEQEEGHPLRPAQLSDWLRAEGRYLAALIQGPLHWWGLCDLALSAPEQLLAFRLTPLAHYLFQGQPLDWQAEESVPLGADSRSLTVSADGQVLIPCSHLNWPLIACVEDFAVSVGVRQEQLNYSLNAQSLGNAISQGHDPRTLLALLSQAARESENPELDQLLSSLERRIANYGRVRLYTDVSLVQVADNSVMQQLDAITSLDEQVICAVHPTLLILKQQGVERLLEELKRRGQTPLLHEEG